MRRLLAAWLLIGASLAAHADGGRLLMRQAAGPFVVSLFSQPESIGIGDVDLSAMVEDKASGTLILDPLVIVTLTPPDGGAMVAAQLSHARVTNRLLQDGVVHLPRAGRWHVEVAVTDKGRYGRTDFYLIMGDHSAQRSTIWTFALLPMLAILLFAWVQSAKRALRVGRTEA